MNSCNTLRVFNSPLPGQSVTAEEAGKGAAHNHQNLYRQANLILRMFNRAAASYEHENGNFRRANISIVVGKHPKEAPYPEIPHKGVQYGAARVAFPVIREGAEKTYSEPHLRPSDELQLYSPTGEKFVSAPVSSLGGAGIFSGSVMTSGMRGTTKVRASLSNGPELPEGAIPYYRAAFCPRTEPTQASIEGWLTIEVSGIKLQGTDDMGRVCVPCSTIRVEYKRRLESATVRESTASELQAGQGQEMQLRLTTLNVFFDTLAKTYLLPRVYTHLFAANSAEETLAIPHNAADADTCKPFVNTRDLKPNSTGNFVGTTYIGMARPAYYDMLRGLDNCGSLYVGAGRVGKDVPHDRRSEGNLWFPLQVSSSREAELLIEQAVKTATGAHMTIPEALEACEAPFREGTVGAALGKAKAVFGKDSEQGIKGLYLWAWARRAYGHSAVKLINNAEILGARAAVGDFLADDLDALLETGGDDPAGAAASRANAHAAANSEAYADQAIEVVSGILESAIRDDVTIPEEEKLTFAVLESHYMYDVLTPQIATAMVLANPRAYALKITYVSAKPGSAADIMEKVKERIEKLTMVRTGSYVDSKTKETRMLYYPYFSPSAPAAVSKDGSRYTHTRIVRFSPKSCDAARIASLMHVTFFTDSPVYVAYNCPSFKGGELDKLKYTPDADPRCVRSWSPLFRRAMEGAFRAKAMDVKGVNALRIKTSAYAAGAFGNAEDLEKLSMAFAAGNTEAVSTLEEADYIFQWIFNEVHDKTRADEYRARLNRRKLEIQRAKLREQFAAVIRAFNEKTPARGGEGSAENHMAYLAAVRPYRSALSKHIEALKKSFSGADEHYARASIIRSLSEMQGGELIDIITSTYDAILKGRPRALAVPLAASGASVNSILERIYNSRAKDETEPTRTSTLEDIIRSGEEEQLYTKTVERHNRILAGEPGLHPITAAEHIRAVSYEASPSFGSGRERLFTDISEMKRKEFAAAVDNRAKTFAILKKYEDFFKGTGKESPEALKARLSGIAEKISSYLLTHDIDDADFFMRLTHFISGHRYTSEDFPDASVWAARDLRIQDPFKQFCMERGIETSTGTLSIDWARRDSDYHACDVFVGVLNEAVSGSSVGVTAAGKSGYVEASRASRSILDVRPENRQALKGFAFTPQLGNAPARKSIPPLAEEYLRRVATNIHTAITVDGAVDMSVLMMLVAQGILAPNEEAQAKINKETMAVAAEKVKAAREALASNEKSKRRHESRIGELADRTRALMKEREDTEDHRLAASRALEKEKETGTTSDETKRAYHEAHAAAARAVTALEQAKGEYELCSAALEKARAREPELEAALEGLVKLASGKPQDHPSYKSILYGNLARRSTSHDIGKFIKEAYRIIGAGTNAAIFITMDRLGQYHASQYENPHDNADTHSRSGDTASDIAIDADLVTTNAPRRSPDGCAVREIKLNPPPCSYMYRPTGPAGREFIYSAVAV